QKYDERYINYGFTCIILNDEPRPQRVLCSEVLANDSLQQIERIKGGRKFSLQLDEMTDISNAVQLLAFNVQRGIFLINSKFDEEGLCWNNCISVCTDGAGAMAGKNKGLKAMVHDIAPHTESGPDWVHNPFITNAGCQLSSDQQDTFLELSSDHTLKAVFNSTPLAEFWLLAEAEYPKLSRLAIDVLLPFSSTWLCETTFSVLTYIKNQCRSRLMTVEDDLRLAVSGIKP
ncbi:SCND3 protein, partial [Atractosteus spatula]|nr:SCND3 protein [Atractosteus spatula]